MIIVKKKRDIAGTVHGAISRNSWKLRRDSRFSGLYYDVFDLRVFQKQP